MKTQKELAQEIGISPKHLSDIFVEREVPGRKTAEKLEKITGVPAYAWIWPERYGNPYIKNAPIGEET